MVTKGRGFSRMNMCMTPIGKLLKPEEVLTNGEEALDRGVGEAGDEHQCGLGASCSHRSSTSYLLANFSSTGDHPNSQRSYSQMELTYYK